MPPEAAAEQKPKNDWGSYRLRGLRADVKQKVSAENIPDFVKAFILAEIDALPAECAGAEVNGYGVTHEAPHSVLRSINITVMGIKL